MFDDATMKLSSIGGVAAIAACVSAALFGGMLRVAAASGQAAGGAATAPLGIFTTTITGQEHFRDPNGRTLGPGSPSPGKWRLTLSRGRARLSNASAGFTVTWNTVASAPRRLTIAADPICPRGHARVGVYTYTLLQHRLTFREVKDSCLDRAATLTLHPWRKQ